MFKQLVAMSEEQLSKLAGRILSNEALVTSLQDFLKKALAMRGELGKTVGTVLSLLNVPTRDDLTRLEGKLEEIETLFQDMQNELDRLERK